MNQMLYWLSICVVVPIGIGAMVTLFLLWSESRHPRILCLMYHRLTPAQNHQKISGTEKVFTLPVEEFDRQIEYLHSMGYAFVTPDQVKRHVAGEDVLTGHSVLITIDDGCQSVFKYAYPVLKKRKACATVFVATDPTSVVFEDLPAEEGRVSDDELRSMDDVIQSESHTITHRPLSGLSESEIRHELAESRAELGRILNREVKYLAIPGNWFDQRVMRIAQEVGYQAVWCSWPGSTHAGASLWGLPRVNVEGQASFDQFCASITPWGITQRRVISLVKRLPGRLLGPRLWLPLRRMILGMIPGHYVSARRFIVAGIVMLCFVIAMYVYLFGLA